jgi:hypothetical protein
MNKEHQITGIIIDRIVSPAYNPDFNYGEFDTIKNQAGLNRFRISVWGKICNPDFNSPEFEGIKT